MTLWRYDYQSTDYQHFSLLNDDFWFMLNFSVCFFSEIVHGDTSLSGLHYVSLCAAGTTTLLDNLQVRCCFSQNLLRMSKESQGSLMVLFSGLSIFTFTLWRWLLSSYCLSYPGGRTLSQFEWRREMVSWRPIGQWKWQQPRGDYGRMRRFRSSRSLDSFGLDTSTALYCSQSRVNQLVTCVFCLLFVSLVILYRSYVKRM